MPGVFGYVRQHRADGAGAPPGWDSATRALLHEPEDRIEKHALDGYGEIGVATTGIDERCAGVARLDDLRLVVAFSGEFHEPAWTATLPSAADIARAIGTAFRESGAPFVAKLNGSFCLAIHDEVSRTTLVATDHYASRPVFHASAAGTTVFGPELKLPARAGIVDAVLDDAALPAFLVNGHLLGSRTFFVPVQPLSAGTTLTVAPDASLSTSRYWSYVPDPASNDRGERHYIGALTELLGDAVRSRCAAGGNLVVPISGGVDSRAILALAASIAPEHVTAVSWGTDERAGGDAAVGRAVADQLGIAHTFMPREADRLPADIGEMVRRTDGLTDDPALHHGEVGIMQRIRRELGGQRVLRGDECFGFGGPAADLREALLRVAISDPTAVVGLRELLVGDRADAMISAAGEAMREVRESATATDPLDRKDQLYFEQRLFHYLNRSTYYKLTVVEVQNPLLDRRIIEFVGTLPRQYRLDKLLFRRTEPALAPRLNGVPHASRHSLEDWGAMLRERPGLHTYLRERLLEPGPAHDYLDRGALERLLRRAERPAEQAGQRTRAAASLKAVLRRIPFAYRLVKRAAMPRLPDPMPDTATLLMRCLVFTLWLEQQTAPPVAAH